ncbi:MAG TPA: hypothetical protein VGV37_20705 [Aliidongia sp.]|uniref:hypothetical protein n=1 Tax=Aliidongia sp. TaxID=1914230 RepID=UPI002DDCA114|nr:hypothetical protein [Aliidongia sp.]HEV2676961.1 hypothetical protein [Aliidongia sp.]
MWIMIAGPYTSGAADAAGRAANLRILNQAALMLFERGHIPIIGVNMALPMIECAGPGRFDAIMMPLSLEIADRCDACLRIGEPSRGADDEASRFRARGLPVYGKLEDVPKAAAGP